MFGFVRVLVTLFISGVLIAIVAFVFLSLQNNPITQTAMGYSSSTSFSAIQTNIQQGSVFHQPFFSLISNAFIWWPVLILVTVIVGSVIYARRDSQRGI